jgi:hypothetical protein
LPNAFNLPAQEVAVNPLTVAFAVSMPFLMNSGRVHAHADKERGKSHFGIRTAQDNFG